MSLALQGIPGRNLLPYRSGYGAQILAAQDVRWLPIGATLDWNLVAAVNADTTLPDTQLILNGWRYLRYGQFMTRVTLAAAKILTITGSPTGGTFTIAVTNSATGASTTQTTAGIAPTATGSDVKAALELLNVVGTGNATVTGNAGGPYYITFAPILGTTTVTTANTFTGGSSPASAFSSGGGGLSRSFGPYDPSATDGRQNINRGDCFLLNRTKLMGGSLQLPLQDDIHTGECVIGGTVWGAAVIATTGTHSLAAGPTWTELLAALPDLRPVYA
jgi:hypothetical protein